MTALSSSSGTQMTSPIQWMTSLFDIQGNVSLEEAELVLVHNFSDEKGTIQNVKLINHIWQGHLLLTESAPKEKSVSPAEYDLAKGICSKVRIEGWDDPVYSARFGILKKKEEHVKQWIDHVEFNLAKGNWNAFSTEEESFAFLNLMSNCSEEMRNQINFMKDLLKNGQYKTFTRFVEKAIADVKFRQTVQLKQLALKFWSHRLDVLMESINRGIELHKRVIALVPSGFLFKPSLLTDKVFSLAKFEQFIKGKKFTILNSKSSSFSFTNQPQLWPKEERVETKQEIPSTPVAPKPQKLEESPLLKLNEHQGQGEEEVSQSQTEKAVEEFTPPEGPLSPIAEEDENGLEEEEDTL